MNGYVEMFPVLRDCELGNKFEENKDKLLILLTKTSLEDNFDYFRIL